MTAEICSAGGSGKLCARIRSKIEFKAYTSDREELAPDICRDLADRPATLNDGKCRDCGRELLG